MILQTPIDTSRLSLATLSPDAADGSYLNWMSDPEVLRWLDARFSETGKKRLRQFIKSANADPLVMLLGIYLKDQGRHVGNIKLAVNVQHKRGDLGIILGDKTSWGKGLAAEAITALSDYARETLGLDRLLAGCVAPNTSSIKAFRKAGFAEEGLLHQYWFDGVERFDVVMLGKELRSQ